VDDSDLVCTSLFVRDPEYAVNILDCLDHQCPTETSGSALLAYRPDGSVERYALTPGSTLAVEARGLVRAREPIRRGDDRALDRGECP
jgi:hypothetical protein